MLFVIHHISYCTSSVVSGQSLVSPSAATAAEHERLPEIVNSDTVGRGGGERSRRRALGSRRRQATNLATTVSRSWWGQDEIISFEICLSLVFEL